MTIPREDKASLFAYAWRVINDFDPIPCVEWKFHPTRQWRFDFAWPAHMVAVEVDGNAWNVKGGGRHAQDDDRDKLNHAAAMGWRVLHFSPKQLTDDPAKCVELVRKALEYKP